MLLLLFCFVPIFCFHVLFLCVDIFFCFFPFRKLLFCMYMTYFYFPFFYISLLIYKYLFVSDILLFLFCFNHFINWIFFFFIKSSFYAWNSHWIKLLLNYVKVYSLRSTELPWYRGKRGVSLFDITPKEVTMPYPTSRLLTKELLACLP